MPSIKTLDVRLTEDRMGNALIVIESDIGSGYEATPDHLRKLAEALRQAADHAEARMRISAKVRGSAGRATYSLQP